MGVTKDLFNYLALQYGAPAGLSRSPGAAPVLSASSLMPLTFPLRPRSPALCLLSHVVHVPLSVRPVYRDRLWHLLLHFKMYPRFRQTSTIKDVPLATTFDRLERDTTALARCMERTIGESWAQRHAIHQRPRDVDVAFGPDLLGSLDTMPIYLNRPTCPVLRRATYSGKYKACVLKVQLACTFTGIPVFMSGPHLGAAADITILRDNFPYAIGAPRRGRKRQNDCTQLASSIIMKITHSSGPTSHGTALSVSEKVAGPNTSCLHAHGKSVHD